MSSKNLNSPWPWRSPAAIRSELRLAGWRLMPWEAIGRSLAPDTAWGESPAAAISCLAGASPMSIGAFLWRHLFMLRTCPC